MSKASDAQRAMTYTRRVLGDLPSNHIVQRVLTLGESTQCVRRARARYGSLRDHDRIMNLRRRASLAKKARCGNCGEYAAVAFDMLMLTGCRYPIEYAGYRAPGDHAFVIVGRAANTNPSDPRTWGSDVVVCDAWAGKVVPARFYWSAMPAFPNAIHAPEIDIRWSGLGDHRTTRSSTMAA